jgi:hypothetical protein
VANPSQVVMYGHSLGSCATELAIERLGREGAAAPQIAVSLDGPTDFTFTTWQVLNAPPPSGFGAAWCNSCGTTDADQLTARSSAYGTYPHTYLANPNLAFLRIHDTGDAVVPPGFGCELAGSLGSGSSNYFLYPERELSWPRRKCVSRGCRTLATSTKPARIAGLGSSGSFCPISLEERGRGPRRRSSCTSALTVCVRVPTDLL